MENENTQIIEKKVKNIHEKFRRLTLENTTW
jgi:hypothetical protein